jgi:hypothetical protein
MRPLPTFPHRDLGFKDLRGLGKTPTLLVDVIIHKEIREVDKDRNEKGHFP